MRSVAVLLSGKMRTLDQCANGLRRLVPPHSDIFVYAIQDDDAYKASILKPTALMVEPEPHLAERGKYFLTVPNGNHSVQSQLRQLYSKWRMWTFYESLGLRHDWIIRVRSDNIFLTPMEDIETCEHAVHIPPHSNWFGLNDQFAHGPFELMKTYYQRWLRIDEYVDHGGIFHTERFLKWALADVPVIRSKVWVAVLRPDGQIDPPYHSERWNDPAVEIPQQVINEGILIQL